MKTPRNRGNGRGIAFIREHVGYQGDNCVIWPLSLNSRGYPCFGLYGKPYRAHRFMCVLTHGDPPADKPHAAHSCGNKLCINPRHITWKSASDNELDKRQHGIIKAGKGTRTKLSNADVAFIRASRGYVTAEALAARFKMSRTSIFYWWNSTHEPLPPGTSETSIWRRKHAA